MDEPTLFHRLGGEAGSARILDCHYDRVMEDDHLREYFADVDIERLKAAQLSFCAPYSANRARRMTAPHCASPTAIR
jgi:truncated hemoglobin YjbI